MPVTRALALPRPLHTLIFLCTSLLVLCLLPTLVSAATNLIANPSMETADATNASRPASWSTGRWGTNTATFTYPVAGQSGARAASVNITSYTSGDAKWYFTYVPVTSGTTYHFSDFYKSTVSSYVTVQFKKSDGTFTYLDIGNPGPASDWTQFSKEFMVPPGTVSLTVFHLIKAAGTLTTDNYSLSSAVNTVTFDKGYVSLTFDDGHKSVYQNALPVLVSAGFVSDQFIVSNYVKGQFPAYVSTSQMLDMQSKNQILGAHTRNHRDLTTLSLADAQAEIQGSRQDLLAMGASPVQYFAYPFGAYNAQVEQLVKNAGFLGARTSDGGYNDKNTDPYRLRRQPMLNSTTLDQVKAYITTAQQNHTWVILLFHDVSDDGTTYSVTPAFFQSVVSYLKQQSITPITIGQGISLIQN